jgi:hypothetical protein
MLFSVPGINEGLWHVTNFLFLKICAARRQDKMRFSNSRFKFKTEAAEENEMAILYSKKFCFCKTRKEISEEMTILFSLVRRRIMNIRPGRGGGGGEKQGQ